MTSYMQVDCLFQILKDREEKKTVNYGRFLIEYPSQCVYSKQLDAKEKCCMSLA